MTAPTAALPFTQVAREIAEQQHWTCYAGEALALRMLEAILSTPPQIRSWSAGGKKPRHMRSIHLVHPYDVNYWIAAQGLEYQWRDEK